MGFIASIQNKIRKRKSVDNKKRNQEILTFQTTFHCAGCVNKVQPHLNAIKNIRAWNVELDKTGQKLNVRTRSAHSDEVTRKVKQALAREGYQAERLN